MPGGRPSTYTQELADSLCEALVESDFGLEQVCDGNDKFPSARTVFRWVENNEEFRQQYVRAKASQAEVQAYRGLKEALGATDAQLGRLKWDARRWAASKLGPRAWGDKLDIEHSGSVSMSPELRQAEIDRLIALRADAASPGG